MLSVSVASYLSLIAALTSGWLLHDYRPVTVLVRDAETKKPIAGADVNISYLVMLNPFAPLPSSGKTDKHGVVHLRVAPYERCAGIFCRATAEGYNFPEDTRLSSDDIRKVKCPSLFSTKPPEPLTLVRELYADPHPTVELIVPPGYRGLFRADTEIVNEESCVVGQRIFTATVSSAGMATIRGSQVLCGNLSPDFRARYADGTELPSPRFGSDDVVALRWVTCTERSHFFVVGTQRDYDEGYAVLHKKNPSGSWSNDHDALKNWPNLPKKEGRATVDAASRQ
jgi:hypothetical protein